MKKMNRWDVYQKVREHLLTQMEKSINSDEECMYRDYKGLACAFGALIPDEIYSPKMERRMASCIMGKFPRLGELFEDEVKSYANSFVNDLQEIHDEHEPEEWEELLNDFQNKWFPEMA